MSCEELRGSYELYALGLLDEPERSEIESHLQRQCAACIAELNRARGLNAAMFAAAPASAPAAQLRTRILASVGANPRRGVVGWWPYLAGALPAAIAAVVLAFQLSQHRSDMASTARRLRQMESAVALMTEPETRQITFGKGPQGRVLVNEKRGVLLLASNLPAAPAGKIYELWIIPKAGPPKPAGLFQSDGTGNAMHLAAGPIDLGTTGAVAVTLEPESGSSAPTTTPIIVAPLAD